MSKDIFEKIRDRYYDTDVVPPKINNVPCPDCGADKLVRDIAKLAYCAGCGRDMRDVVAEAIRVHAALQDQIKESNKKRSDAFYNDAIEAAGIAKHPLKDYLWGLAWDQGHASGFEEIVNYLLEYTDALPSTCEGW